MWEGDKLEAAFITANHNFYRELIFFQTCFPTALPATSLLVAL
jgi:hypothetical protein